MKLTPETILFFFQFCKFPTNYYVVKKLSQKSGSEFLSKKRSSNKTDFFATLVQLKKKDKTIIIIAFHDIELEYGKNPHCFIKFKTLANTTKKKIEYKAVKKLIFAADTIGYYYGKSNFG